jgi:colanic acid biosynthesis glycosyl transferase WcaI
VRILVLTPYYAPDLGPSAALYEMLCEDLAGFGHQVSVISAVPHYPTGRVAQEFRGSARVWRRERRGGVDVTRVWVPSLNRARLGLRALSLLCYQLLAAAAAIGRSFDVVIASNPAFEVAVPVFLLAFIRRKQFVYSVHEIYPDIGVALGIFRHRVVIRFIDWLERLCCVRAAHVRVLSAGYRRALEARGVAAAKLTVIRDWIDTEFIRPLPRQNAFSRRWGLDEHFVVLYAGNIGPTQGLEFVLRTAQLLAGQPSIRFVFVGDGAAKGALEKLSRSRDLANVVFIPFQPRERLPEVLAAADISLVSMRKGLVASSVPSKLYSILSSGRPAIAAVDDGSDIAELVREAGCGICAPPEDPEALRRAVLELFGDGQKRRRMGESGREFVVRCHSRRQAVEKFQELLDSLRPHAQRTRKTGMPERNAVPLRGMDEPLESVSCLLCGGTETRVVARGMGRAQLVRCRNDGLVFLAPRPTEPFLREFHSGFVRSDNLELFDGYRREILGREAEAVKAFVPGGSLLDVGCATGTFFDNFPEGRWRLFGVDTSGLGVEQARANRRAQVFRGTLTEAQFPADFFDVVTILDTIYYTRDPRAELREVRRILKEGGLLAIEIPGLTYTFLREKDPVCWLVDGRPSRGLANSHHLYYFSPKTIRLLLEETGFRLIQMIPEQASLRGGPFHRILNGLHFRAARALYRGTRGRISIAAKELYLARKLPSANATNGVPAGLRHGAQATAERPIVSA